MVDSFPRRGVEAEVDHLRKVSGDEQANLARGQSVIAHFAFVGQEGNDVGRRCTRHRSDVIDNFMLQPLQAGLFLGTFSSHGGLVLKWVSDDDKRRLGCPWDPLFEGAFTYKKRCTLPCNSQLHGG